MIRTAVLALGAAAMPAIAQEARADQVVAYVVAPVTDAGGAISSLRVAMTFDMEPDGSTLVRLPWRYADRDDLFENLTDVILTGGSLVATERAAEFIATAPAGTRVTLTYSVKSGIDHAPTPADGQPFTPWILDDWFAIDGSTLFARPQVDASTTATFRWTGDPDMPFASDLERLSSPLAGGTVGEVFTGTMLGGQGIRVVRRGSIRLALRGAPGFSDDALLDGIVRLVAAERGFWGDALDAPYLVTMIAMPVAAGHRPGMGGTGHGDDAFAAVISGEMRFRDVMGKLFAHEIFHGWLPTGLGVEAVPRHAWFGEGFTEYYGRLLPLRAGVVSLDDFVSTWNEALLDYMASPARNRTNQELAEEHWANRDSSLMSYLRGSMLAALWNARLKDATHGAVTLDDLMRGRREDASGSRAPEVLFASDDLPPGLDFSDDLAAFVVRGETIVLPPGTFGPCLRVEQTTIPVYERGFDLEASLAAGMTVTGVSKDGPAHAAGLRDGMRLVRPVSGRYLDSTVESAWQVEANGVERTLRWLPAGKGIIQSQRIVRTVEAPDDGAGCGL